MLEVGSKKQLPQSLGGGLFHSQTFRVWGYLTEALLFSRAVYFVMTEYHLDTD